MDGKDWVFCKIGGVYRMEFGVLTGDRCICRGRGERLEAYTRHGKPFFPYSHFFLANSAL